MQRKKIINTNLNSGPYRQFLKMIISLAKEQRSSYVCVANVHMIIKAWQSPDFATVVNNANMITPDGMPLTKSLKILYGLEQERVAGMDLMPDLITESEMEGLSIFFYGSSDEVLDRISRKINTEHPELIIAGTYSPPFRILSEEEERIVTEGINNSGANIVMVALGCPNQELWMARHKGKINAVMIGLGGAFPVYAGIQPRAPKWMQFYSLEWLYRLRQEPRRLFKRYLVTNTLFLVLLVRAVVVAKIGNLLSKEKTLKR